MNHAKHPTGILGSWNTPDAWFAPAFSKETPIPKDAADVNPPTHTEPNGL